MAGRSWLSRNVLALGSVSLLTDAASEMVIPLLPAFLAMLGAGAVWLGLIEGLADATASVLRLVSGWLADRSGRRRPLVLAGYGISSLVRPLFALAATAAHVTVVRVLDRVGKGLRSSPRDALLAAAVVPEQRALAFGFHRSMDHAGAILGPLIAFAVLSAWTEDLRTLFWLTAIPGALAVLGVLAVREAPAAAAEPRPVLAPRRELALFLLPLSLFTLGKASDVFLILLASAQHAPLAELPLLWIGLHVMRMLAATPGGWLAGRYGLRRTIAAGWLVHGAVFVGLAFAESQDSIRALIIAYGLHAGLAEGAEKALIAKIAPSRRWGTAFGWYHFAVGLMTLVANVAFGALWEGFGHPVAFLGSAGIGAVAVVALAIAARVTQVAGRAAK